MNLLYMEHVIEVGPLSKWNSFLVKQSNVLDEFILDNIAAICTGCCVCESTKEEHLPFLWGQEGRWCVRNFFW